VIDELRLRRAEQFLSELECPRRAHFTAAQLAEHVGGSARAWQRACASGEVMATKGPKGYSVAWDDLVRYVAQRMPEPCAERASRRNP
jgi:hypothetical protein